MSACQAQSFSGVDAHKWTCIKDNVRERYGFAIGTDNGTASESGFTFTWSYDSAAQKLEVQCADSPFWAPCSTINGQIQDIVRKCGV